MHLLFHYGSKCLRFNYCYIFPNYCYFCYLKYPYFDLIIDHFDHLLSFFPLHLHHLLLVFIKSLNRFNFRYKYLHFLCLTSNISQHHTNIYKISYSSTNRYSMFTHYHSSRSVKNRSQLRRQHSSLFSG